MPYSHLYILGVVMNYKLIFVIVLLINGLVSANEEKTFANSIMGQWQGEGQMFGQSAEFSMHWESILGGKFIRLNFINKFGEVPTKHVMKAHAYYDLSNNSGNWFDSRGSMFSLSLQISPHSLLVFWGNEETEKGKTSYTIDKFDSMVFVEDYIYKEGKYQLFAKANYQRKE